MAMIEVSPETGGPRCSGCHAEMRYLPHMLNSRARGTAMIPEIGSMGPEVAAFAAQHSACREPKIERLPGGALCVDRRGVRP